MIVTRRAPIPDTCPKNTARCARPLPRHTVAGMVMQEHTSQNIKGGSALRFIFSIALGLLVGAAVLLALTGSVFAVRGTVEAAVTGIVAFGVALGTLLALIRIAARP